MIRTKFILCILLLSMISGCATFRSGDSYTYSRGDSGKFKLPEEKNLNILVNVDKNFDSSDQDYNEVTRNKIINRIKPILRKNGYQVTVLSEINDDITDYVEISVVMDFGHDFRKDDYTEWRYVGAILSGLSMTIIPARDIDVYQYIVFKNFRDGKLISNSVFEQDSNRYVGLFFLFLSPFYTIRESVIDTVEESLISVVDKKV